MTGVPILTQQFGSGLNVTVQAAWGADIYTDASTWTWTDITADVLYNGGRSIQITPGRLDESATPQPANCQFRLRNTSGAYTQGGQSPYYPNVKRGTPLQVTVTYSATTYTRFFGYLAQLTPGWDTTGKYAYVDVVAGGAKRRLLQQKSVVSSPITRTVPSLTGLVSYWPCEEGQSATSFASALGNSPIVTWGTPKPASFSGFPGSATAPTLNQETWSVPMEQAPAFGAGGTGQVRFLVATPVDGLPDQTCLWRGYFAGTLRVMEIRYAGTPADGGLRLMGWDQSNTVRMDSGTIGFAQTQYAFVQMGLSWNDSSGSAVCTLSTINPDGTGGFTTQTATGYTAGVPTGMLIDPNADILGVSIGQVYVQNVVTSIFDIQQQFLGYSGEYTGNRMDRLASESGEYLHRNTGTTHQLMGVQALDDYLNLMEMAAQVEQGILYDGFQQGLSFIAQDEMTSVAASITLDASLGQLADQVAPVDDDQQTTNTFTATRTNGSSYTYQDTTSTQSISAIGIYDGSATVDLDSDGQQLQDYATWQVGQGTFAGYRFPNAEFWLHRNPELLTQWLASYIGCRLSITNLIDVRTQLPSYVIDQLVQGWTESIDQFMWTVVTNCTPYEGWRVGEVANTSGDANPFILRPDTDGASLAAAVTIGASTASVATISGAALWTTTADDFPFDVNMGGYQVSVTSITGSTSPQTFHLSWYSPTPSGTIASGASVSLWAPTVVDVLAM